MIGLRHHIGNLRPTHSILQRHLIRCWSHAGRLHLCPSHIPKHRTAHRVLLLTLPPATPHHQTDERQHNDDDRRYRSANRNAQHFTVNLALGAIVIAVAAAHLIAVVVRTGAAIVAERQRTCVTLAASPLRLIRPGIAQSGGTLTSEAAPDVRARGRRMTVVQIRSAAFVNVWIGNQYLFILYRENSKYLCSVYTLQIRHSSGSTLHIQHRVTDIIVSPMQNAQQLLLDVLLHVRS